MMRAAAAIASLAVSVALIVATSACDQGGSASSKAHYGECPVSGHYGEFHLSPRTAGALTVKTTLAGARLVERRQHMRPPSRAATSTAWPPTSPTAPDSTG